MIKYVVKVKVTKPGTQNQTKEIEYSGKRHISIECACTELEDALEQDAIRSGWIVEEETK